jgi:hypothetical protein
MGSKESPMQRKYTIPAVVMFAYAALLLLAGLIAFFAAPAAANPWTALMIPGAAAFLMVICGVMTLMAGSSQKLGRVGAHAGVMLTILFTLVFGYTAFARTQALQRHPAAMAEYREAVQTGAIDEGDDQARRAFFGERRAARHDIAYLVRTLWFVTVISGATFVVLIMVRPKPSPATEPPPA